MKLVVTLVLLMCTHSLSAAVVVTAIEKDNNVILSTPGGSLYIDGLEYLRTSAVGPIVNAATAALRVGKAAPSDQYRTIFSPPGNYGPGTGGATFPIGSGSFFGISPAAGVIAVPQGYVSETELGPSSAIIEDATFASLGMTPGTYQWFWVGGFGDSVTLQVVPLPAGFWLFGSAVSILLLRRRSKELVSV